MRGLSWMMSLACVCAAVVGCNGDDDGDGNGGGSCGPFQACGGDVEGEWTVDGVCFDDIESLFASQIDEPECDGLFRNADVNASGSYTFANGVGTTDVTLAIDVEANWTAECFMAANGVGTVDFDQICPALEQTYLGTGVFEGAACMVAGGACSCMLTATPMMVQSSGMYRIEGNAIVDETDGDSSPYCVTGDRLTLQVTNNALTGRIMLSR